MTTPSMVVLEFTREFTKGNLIGLRHEDSMRFPGGVKDAQRWVKVINERNTEGKVDYKVVAYKILETVERKGG